MRRLHVDRARYESELARRRFLRVDPEDRLVAASLEAEWKLRALSEAEQNYERQRQADQFKVSAAQREQVLALATDFPRLWNDPGTPNRERKRMVRLLNRRHHDSKRRTNQARRSLPAEDQYRSTRVIAKATGFGKLYVRTRTGYLIPPERRMSSVPESSSGLGVSSRKAFLVSMEPKTFGWQERTLCFDVT